MVWSIKFKNGDIKTYDYITEVHKDGKIYKAPFKGKIRELFSGEIVFIHSDGRRTVINGDNVEEVFIG